MPASTSGMRTTSARRMARPAARACVDRYTNCAILTHTDHADQHRHRRSVDAAGDAEQRGKDQARCRRRGTAAVDSDPWPGHSSWSHPVRSVAGRSRRAKAVAVETDLMKFEVFDMPSVALAVQAAKNYRTLRNRGRTVRKTIDVVIATFCRGAALASA